MTTVTKNMLKDIRPEIEAALEEVGIKHGIIFNCANAKFTNLDFTFQLKGEVIDAGDGKSKAEAEWEKDSYLYGLQDVKFGARFQSNSKVFFISGIDFKKHKYPILANDSEGRGYKFEADSIKRHFKIAI